MRNGSGKIKYRSIGKNTGLQQESQETENKTITRKM